jgi:hypothetical protein
LTSDARLHSCAATVCASGGLSYWRGSNAIDELRRRDFITLLGGRGQGIRSTRLSGWHPVGNWVASGEFSSIPVTRRRYPTTSRRIAMRRKMAQKLSRRTRLQLTGRGRNHPPRRGIFSAAQAGEVGDQPVGFLQRSALIFLRPQSRLLSAHLSRMITGRGVLMTLRAL